VPTLLSIAENMRAKTNDSLSYYLTLMDAKRMDVFTAIFDNEGNEIVASKAVTLDENYRTEISSFENIGIGGNCLEKCKTIFNNDFVFVENTNCDSRSMIGIAEKKLREGKIENTAYFEPFYLKEFEARVKKNI
jgi:tRNA threonylcarbamoyladenosine biosynthesis protein TsaB